MGTTEEAAIELAESISSSDAAGEPQEVEPVGLMSTLSPRTSPRREVPLRERKVSRCIGLPQRAELARMATEAREALSRRDGKPWSRKMVANRANACLAHPEIVKELEIAGLDVAQVNVYHVESLELARGSSPMMNGDRRVRILGMSLALGLDRALVNLVGGGI